MTRNGTKRWLIYVGTAILLTVSGWLLQTVVAQGNRITAQEERVDGLGSRLERIEGKIDQLLMTR